MKRLISLTGNRHWNLPSPQTYEILYSPTSRVLILKSIPMVEINDELKVLSANRKIIHVFPTPLSPIRSNLKK